MAVSRPHRLVAALSLLVSLASFAYLVQSRRNEAVPSTRMISVRRPSIFPADIGARLNSAADRCGLGSLLSIELRGSGREGLHAQWKGTTAASLDFLAAAETAGLRGERLAAESDGRTLRWTLDAEPDAPRRATATTQRPAIKIDPFFIEAPRPAPARPVAAKPAGESETARREREEKEHRLADEAAQAARLEQRRRDIIAGLRLSATMNNGREPLALVDVLDAGRRRAVTLRRGDAILGATVADIDDRAGSLQLDVDGKMRLSFHVGSAATP